MRTYPLVNETGFLLQLSAERFRTAIRWGGAVLGLSWLVPFEIVGRQPHFVWQMLRDLPPVAAVAALAPVAAGGSLVLASVIARDPQRLATAALAAVCALLVVTWMGAEVPPWDVLPIAESWTHGAAPPVLALSLAMAAANLAAREATANLVAREVTANLVAREVTANLAPHETRARPRSGRVERALWGASIALMAFYYVWPVAGEAPLANAARGLANVAFWPGWRAKVGCVLLALFVGWPAWFLAVAAAPRWRRRRSRGSDAQFHVRPLGLSWFGVVLIAVLYRSMVGLEGEAGVLSTAASIIVLGAVVLVTASAVSAYVQSWVASPDEPTADSHRERSASTSPAPARRGKVWQAAGCVLCAIVAAAVVELALARPAVKGVVWRLGPTSDDGDQLFRALLPAWNDARAARDFYGRREPDPAEPAAAMVSRARSIDVHLAHALELLASEDDLRHVPSRRWYRLVADVNEASRRANLPYYLDPTAEVLDPDHGWQRWFRLDTYRIEQVHRHGVGSASFTTLLVRLMAPVRGGPSSLGLSRDVQPYALVVLDEVDAYVRQLQKLADKDPPQCVDDFAESSNDEALRRCGGLLEELAASTDLRTAVVGAVERHELQHQIDGPRLRRSTPVFKRLGAHARDIQAKADRELSGYLAQFAASPRLTLIRLLQLVHMHQGGVDREAALLVLEAVARRDVHSRRAASGAFLELAELREETLRGRASQAHARLYGEGLKEPEPVSK